MSIKNGGPGRILVALDGSSQSRSAARIAIHIARRQHYLVHGLYVVDSQLITGAYSTVRNQFGEIKESLSRPNMVLRLEEKGYKLLAQLETDCQSAEVPVVSELIFGNVSEVVIQKSGASDLIAMGKQGPEHPNDASYLGQNLKAIMQYLHLPILLGGDDRFLIRKILVASPNEASVRTSAKSISLFEGALRGEAALYESGRQSAPEGSNIPPQTILSDYELIQCVSKSRSEIILEVNQQGIDLLILAGFSRQTHLLGANNASVEQIIAGVQMPVLVV